MQRITKQSTTLLKTPRSDLINSDLDKKDLEEIKALKSAKQSIFFGRKKYYYMEYAKWKYQRKH